MEREIDFLSESGVGSRRPFQRQNDTVRCGVFIFASFLLTPSGHSCNSHATSERNSHCRVLCQINPILSYPSFLPPHTKIVSVYFPLFLSLSRVLSHRPSPSSLLDQFPCVPLPVSHSHSLHILSDLRSDSRRRINRSRERDDLVKLGMIFIASSPKCRNLIVIVSSPGVC